MSEERVRKNVILLKSPLTGEELFEYQFSSYRELDEFGTMAAGAASYWIERQGGWNVCRAKHVPLPDPEHKTYFQFIARILEKQKANKKLNTTTTKAYSLGETFAFGLIMDTVLGTQVAAAFGDDTVVRYFGYEAFQKQMVSNLM